MARQPAWSVKGIDDETRDAARRAAGAAGLTIGAWIDRTILAVARRDAMEREAATPPQLPPAPDSATADSSPDNATLPPASETADEDGAADQGDGGAAGHGRVKRRIAVLAVVVLVIAGGGTALFRHLDGVHRPEMPLGSTDPAGAKPANPAPATGSAGPPPTAKGPAGTETAALTPLQRLRHDAEAGKADAQYDLGVLYASGRGVEKDETAAVRWFEKAAAQGLAPAQYNLGVLMERGRGVAPDPAMSFFWYRSAAEQGHARAQHNLATAYAAGRGTPRNYAEAARWFGKAAESGLVPSQVALAQLYEAGLGVPRDPEVARRWYQRAADQGDDRARGALARLEAADRAARIANAKPPTRAAIREIQRLLSRLSFDPGPADGVPGKRTASAIRLFQRFAGMPEDGKPSNALLEELRAVADTR